MTSVQNGRSIRATIIQKKLVETQKEMGIWASNTLPEAVGIIIFLTKVQEVNLVAGWCTEHWFL